MRVLLFIVLMSLASCQPQAHDIRETRFLLGTIVDITVYGEDDDAMLRAVQQAVEAMQKVEEKFSTHGSAANSVTAFNQAGSGQEIKLDEEVNQLLRQSLDIHRQTSGAFDPTLGRLNRLWGFSSDTRPTKPLNESTVRLGLSLSGVKHLEQINANVWSKDIAGLELDFGAIAKGYAIDKAVEALKLQGVNHAVVNAGGDIRTVGDHGGKPWKIAVRHPRLKVPLGWLEVKRDISIVTSGDYERFFDFEGKRYHHILNPHTGYPAMLNQSITVVANDAALADALSTAIFVLSYEEGIGIIENSPGVEAIWVDRDMQLHLSSGMKGAFHLLETRGSVH